MNLCEWHKDQYEIDEEIGYECCPECGRMLSQKTCTGCGKEFLDWEDEGFDDVCAAPRCTSFGDLVCSYCLPHIEREIEKMEDEEAEYWGGYDEVNNYNLIEPERDVDES